VKFLLLPSTLGFSASALISGALLIWTTVSQRQGARAVSSSDAIQLINNSNAIVIDVRDASEFAAGSVTGARNIPSAELAARSADLARFKNRPVVLVCNSGAVSAKAVAPLTAAGFTEVYNLSGGIRAWREAGMPLVKPATKDSQGALKKEKT
jgi:rhodanese-related sulfurtransferase